MLKRQNYFNIENIFDKFMKNFTQNNRVEVIYSQRTHISDDHNIHLNKPQTTHYY